MTQQLLHYLEFSAHTSQQRRIRSDETCASQCISGFRPSPRLGEHVFVKSLVPKMDAVLGAVCSQKSSRRALCTLIVFATPKARWQRADEQVPASATIPSCTDQRHRKRWIALRSSFLGRSRCRPISSRTTRSAASPWTLPGELAFVLGC